MDQFEDLITELRDYCDFEEDSSVYIFCALARGKENEGITHNDRKMIREVARRPEDIPQTIQTLQVQTEESEYDWRLYMSVNARNARKASFLLRDRINEWTENLLQGDTGINKKFRKTDSEFHSCLQKQGCRQTKNFMFDIDSPEDGYIDRLRRDIERHSEILIERETPNGHHIVTEGFNYNELDSECRYELKFDSLLFLSFL